MDVPRYVTVVDFETTGSVPGFPNEPWQIGMVALGPDGIVPGSAYSSLLRVARDRPFSRSAPGRWASLRGELAEAPSLLDLWEDVSPRLSGVPLAAHNAATERTVLRSAAPMARFGPWVDTLSLSRAAFPGLGSYSLSSLIGALGLQAKVDAAAPGGAWHDALYDAVAAAVLLDRLRSERVLSASSFF